MTRLVRDSKIRTPHLGAREYWEIIADNLREAGWSWGCVSEIDSDGRAIWIADAHRNEGNLFVVRGNEHEDLCGAGLRKRASTLSAAIFLLLFLLQLSLSAFECHFPYEKSGMAEGVGFEPTVGFPTLDFESSALNRTQPPFL